MFISHLSRRIKNKQRGAAFIVMMVILIMGVTIVLVGALSKVTLQTARNEKSSDMLALTKEVLIGYILQGGSNPPGWMMYPDVLDRPSASEKKSDGTQGSNYDGEWEGGCFNALNALNTPPYTPLTATASNMRCLGRLPWKKLGMSISTPSENDPIGFMPWYAYSRNLIDANTKINSELLNTNTYPWLKVYDMNGTLLSDRVAFVIIIPGAVLPNQSRPPSPNLANPDQYLDSISLPPGCNPSGTPCTTTYRNYDLTETFVTGDEHRWMSDPANPSKQIEDPTYQFNDKLLYVTIDDLMPLIEKRIAREVKSCLDDYAAVSNNKYPWAAKVADSDYVTRMWSDLAGDSTYLDNQTFHSRFGRIPVSPSINTTTSANGSSDPNIQAVKNALNALQTAETNCQTNDTLQTALNQAGSNLLATLASITNPPFSNTFINSATAAGNAPGTWNGNCNYIDNHGTFNSVQTSLNTAVNAFNNTTITVQEDSTIKPDWNWTSPTSTSCNRLFTSSYWDDWKNLIFYQVDDKFRPNGSTTNCTNNCLTITGSGNTNPGSGNYRATILVAGKAVGFQQRSTTLQKQDRTNYLDGSINPTGKTNVPTTSDYETYRTTDNSYMSTTNDQVLCLDGRVNCK